MSDQRKTVRKLRLAAGQRLEAALFLFRESTHHREAVYLAGYSVECSLKALILSRTPKRLFKAFHERLTHGKKAHDFEYLTAIFKRQPINGTVPGSVAESLLIAASWSSEMRYEVDFIDYDDAGDFLHAASGIHRWASRNLS